LVFKNHFRGVKYKFIIITLFLLLGAILQTPVQAQPGEALQVPWPGFEVLKGRWLALKGEVPLEINKIDSLGRKKVQYFNPKPVHVAQAQAARDGKETNVLMKLRDPGSPCCTYDLTYEPGLDQLKGISWQKGNPKSTEVVFIRVKLKKLGTHQEIGDYVMEHKQNAENADNSERAAARRLRWVNAV
jgi:hypothetical protein